MEMNDLTQAHFHESCGQRKLTRVRPRTHLRFEVHVAEHCNLNCENCFHFCSVADEEFLNIEEYKRDCARLSELFKGEAERIYLLGGEPLLNTNLPEIMEITRNAFQVGQIAIITNGILLAKMGNDFWEACKKYRVEILPTKYPISVDYDGMEEYADSRGVTYKLFSKMDKMMRNPLTLRGDQPVKENYDRCEYSNECLTLRHGKLYTCEFPVHARHLKKYFHLDLELSEEDGIDIYAVGSAKELMEKLASPIPFCRYCKIDCRGFFQKWSVSQKDRYEWINFEWTKEDIQYLKEAGNIYAYCAGDWGKRTVDRLQKNGVAVKAVLVNHPEENPESILTVPVLAVDDVRLTDKNSVCLLAASDFAETELEKEIRRHGFRNIVRASAKTGRILCCETDYGKIEDMKSASAVYVYGAGVRGKEVISWLRENQIAVKTILVTNTEGNQKMIDGIPVVALDSATQAEENSICLLAIDDYTAKNEMQRRARERGFKRIIPLFEV